MRVIFNNYLHSTIIIILLNSFVGTYANGLTNKVKVEQGSFEAPSQSVHEKFITTTTSSYNAYGNEIKLKLLFDAVEVEEKKSKLLKLAFNNHKELGAFNTARLFKSFSSSKDFQKNVLHPQKGISLSRLRLHVQFQVFII